MNSDEALKCLRFAKQKYETGDIQQAIKLTKKSLGMQQSKQALDYLTFLNNAKPSSTKASKYNAKSSTQRDNPSKPAEYTREQLQEVLKIKQHKTDYYKVLNLEKSATDLEIKKAYRKSALKFHPDKNKAPGADEAFKTVNKAFTVLQDPQSRASYDSFGPDAPQNSASHFSSNRNNQNPFFQNGNTFHFAQGEQVDPEELFNMFFGGNSQFTQGSFFGASNAQRHNRRRRTQTDEEESKGFFSRFIPIIIILVSIMLSSIFGNSNQLKTPDFGFEKSSVFNKKLKTNNRNIEYFVNKKQFDKFRSNKNFDTIYNIFEKEVEANYINSLSTKCQQEKIMKINLINKHKGTLFGIGRNDDKLLKAQNMKLKHCDELKKYL